MKIALVTGGFDPVHSGHIAYFRAARSMADMLIVGVNSDSWLERKKGQSFLPYEERSAILREMTVVDQVIGFDDSDGSACDAIRKTRSLYPDADIMFCNGGDRTAANIPEMRVAEDDEAVSFHFSVGGSNKLNSSSLILANWNSPVTRRPWGSYKVLDDMTGYKIKILEVEGEQTLSLQRHRRRAETWQILEGHALIRKGFDKDELQDHRLDAGDVIEIDVLEWHQLINISNIKLRVLETQRGECREEDIERLGVPSDYGK
jgi:D-beta-D-heptose 7-phosphate kinase/D-beta-D-heptose 1-phosphate adenosyltransferase